MHVIDPVPVDYEGGETAIRLEAMTDFAPFSPTHVTGDPFPFRSRPARFTLQRRALPKRQWTPSEFVEVFEATPLQEIELVLEPA